MRRILIVWALFAALVSAAPAQHAPLAGLDYVNRALREFEHPGLALAIVKNDSVVYAKGFGVRKLGDPAPVDPHTLFAIGSSSKAFTGLAMAMLVDSGKVRWDEPMATYLPGFQLSEPYCGPVRQVRARCRAPGSMSPCERRRVTDAA